MSHDEFLALVAAVGYVTSVVRPHAGGSSAALADSELPQVVNALAVVKLGWELMMTAPLDDIESSRLAVAKARKVEARLQLPRVLAATPEAIEIGVDGPCLAELVGGLREYLDEVEDAESRTLTAAPRSTFMRIQSRLEALARNGPAGLDPGLVPSCPDD